MKLTPEGEPTSQSHLRGGVLLAIITSLAFPCLRVFNVCLNPSTHFPDFITSWSLLLMLSIAFFWKQKKITSYDIRKSDEHSKNCDTKEWMKRTSFTAKTWLISMQCWEIIKGINLRISSVQPLWNLIEVRGAVSKFNDELFQKHGRNWNKSQMPKRSTCTLATDEWKLRIPIVRRFRFPKMKIWSILLTFVVCLEQTTMPLPRYLRQLLLISDY